VECGTGAGKKCAYMGRRWNKRKRGGGIRKPEHKGKIKEVKMQMFSVELSVMIRTTAQRREGTRKASRL
jgi:hypothetical protein